MEFRCCGNSWPGCALNGNTSWDDSGPGSWRERMSGLLEENAELSDSDAESIVSGEPELGDEGMYNQRCLD